MVRQPTWQRIILLIVLGYEGAGGLSGGGLLVAAPDGRLMNMSVAGMHGFFPDFLVPGLILIGLGILTVAAFVAVWRRSWIDWLLAGLALGGLAVWFVVEIAVLRQVSWIHAMWGLPVLVGGLMALPLIPAGSPINGKAFVARHPVSSFFALTFIISWGGILAVIGPADLASGGNFGPGMVVAYPFMYLGPALAGLLCTGLLAGRTGWRELLARLLRWRVGARWYAVALLAAPLSILAVLLALSLASPAFLPRAFVSDDRAFLLTYSLVAGLMTAFFQELGWTGFAVDTMLRRGSGVLRTGLVVGLVFGAWNGLVVYWSNGATHASGALPLVIFLGVSLLTWQTAYRVLIAWLYDRTGSLLLATLTQASLITFWTNLTPTPPVVGAPLVTYYLALTMVWAVAAGVILAHGRRRSRQPLREVRPAPSPGRTRAA